MALQDFAWDLDPTGLSPANLITGEIQNISPVNGVDYHYFIPDAAPYHENSMQVVHIATGQPLTKGVDWVPGLFFEAASNSYDQLPIYGAVVLLNLALVGSFRIQYQTLGGEFTLDENTILNILENTLADPRTTNWEVVTNKPSLYDPNAHLHHTSETGSYEALVAEVAALAQAIRDTNAQALQLFQLHINDKDNPHDTDLTKLGIERFADVYKATLEQVLLGENDVNFVTSALVRAAIVQAFEGFQVPEPDIDADSVGLGNVPNWTVASQQDLDNAQSQRFLDPAQVQYMVNKIIAQLPIGQLQQFIDAFTAHVTNSNNPHGTNTGHLGIALANGMLGAEGQVSFFIDDSQPFNAESDWILNRLGIVENQAELTAQLLVRESFQEVFSSWRRIAFSLGNPASNPAELGAWSYNSATDTVNTTINSGTNIGLLSNEKTVGDYVFEAELSSTNNDDDFIGFVLGMVPVEGGYSLLTLYRSATVPAAGGANLRLSVSQADGNLQQLAGIGNLPSFTNGWAGYNALGPVKLKVERVGTVLTMQTSDAGGNYNQTLVYDLNDNVLSEPFAGPVNLGYAAFSQAASTWKTLQRTGANPSIVSLFNNQVYHWNGADYTLSPSTTLADVIKTGRLYRNATTKRTYYASAPGSAVKILGKGSDKDHTSPQVTRDRLVHNDIDNVAHVGYRVTFYDQNAGNGNMTPRGYLQKNAGDYSTWDMIGLSATSDTIMFMGNTSGRKGGIRANQSGVVGFIKPDGTWFGYFDPTGVFQHNGMNRLSDGTVKIGQTPLDVVDHNVDVLELVEWFWSQDTRVPEHLRGEKDSGAIAQAVQKAFPNCVSRNSETGLLTLDDGKFAMHLALYLLRRLKALESKE